MVIQIFQISHFFQRLILVDILVRKKRLYGLGIGYFTGSLGAIFYASHEITEAMSWGVSYDFIGTFADFALLAQVLDSDSSYDVYLFLEPKLSFGLSYSL